MSRSKLCKDIDDRVNAFLDRPLVADWPYPWLDATYLKQREGGRITSVAAIIAVAVNTDGKREIVGLHIGPSKADLLVDVPPEEPDPPRPAWHKARDLGRARGQGRNPPGDGLNVAKMPRSLDAQRAVLRAKSPAEHGLSRLRQAFIQFDRPSASQTLRHVADQLRGKWPKLGAFADESEADALAHMDFPAPHRAKLHSTNPLERLNKEVKRRADVVGIFPNEGAIIRPIGAVLLEANDEWQLQHRYMQTEVMAELTPPLIETVSPQISTQAA